LRLGVNNSSLLCIAEVSRKDAEPLRFRNGSTCGRVKASSIQDQASPPISARGTRRFAAVVACVSRAYVRICSRHGCRYNFGAREATIASKRGSLRS